MANLNSLYENYRRNNAFLPQLISSLMKLGHNVAENIFENYQIFNIIIDDIDDYILHLAYSIIETYKFSTKSFSEFAKYVMYKRLVTKIAGFCATHELAVMSLDDILEDGTTILDLIPDNTCQSIPDQISLSEVDLVMSSPKSNDKPTLRLERKVYKMVAAGYSSQEIKNQLNLTEAQYRYLLRLINKDLKELQNKINMK